MTRNPRFSPSTLYVHFQPRMAAAYPPAVGIPSAMQDCLDRLERPAGRSIGDRLNGLQRLFDDEMPRMSPSV